MTGDDLISGTFNAEKRLLNFVFDKSKPINPGPNESLMNCQNSLK